MIPILSDPLPEIPVSRLEARVEELHELKSEAVLAAAEAYLRGLPGTAARAEVRRLEEELRVVRAAQRLIHAHDGIHR